MDEQDFSIDSLFADMPKENRLGFFTDSSLDLGSDYAAMVAMLHGLLNAEEPYTDDEGYEWQIIAHVIDEEHHRLAWVEWREQERGRITYDNYYLKARDSAGALLLWEVETYNPYFGCTVRFLQWVEDAVIMIYQDKHDTYVASLKKDSEVKRIEISPKWSVEGNLLIYSTAAGEAIIKLQLPSLERA